MLNLVLTGALGNNHREVIDEAKKSSLPEVLGDAGITLNPCDEQSFCESLLSSYKSPLLRTKLSAKAIVQSKIFTWKNFSSKTISAYQRVLRTS